MEEIAIGLANGSQTLITMEKFPKNLSIENGKYSLTFYKIKIPSGWKFYVTLSSSEADVVSFDMTEQNGKWRIIPPVPEWVMQQEARLSEIIKFPGGFPRRLISII